MDDYCSNCEQKDKEINQLLEIITNLRTKLAEAREEETNGLWLPNDWRTS